jgi:acyl-CoA synthetase (AMP-forming)/AMP-acid ligase II
VALFAAALAGVPFLPVNYRLGDAQLADVLGRQGSPLVVTDTPERVPGAATIGTAEFLALAAAPSAGSTAQETDAADPDSIAVLLMTSGTTAAPKSAVLRHRNLAAYVFGSVEFASVPETDAALVSVPLTTSPPWLTRCPISTAAAALSTSASSPRPNGWPPWSGNQ